VRAVLPTIHVPTLVIQRLDDCMTTPCHGRYLASHIPGARYFEQPGGHSLRFAASGDTERLLHEIDDFLSAASRPAEPDRVLTTILNIEPAVDAAERSPGLSVDIAAAIAALARPGEILASRTATDLVVGSGISFTHRGTHALTGIPDHWPLFAVTDV